MSLTVIGYRGAVLAALLSTGACSRPSVPDAPPDAQPALPDAALTAGGCPCPGGTRDLTKLPFACWCAEHDCSETIEEYEQRQCGTRGPVPVRTTGCGKVAVGSAGPFGGAAVIFDQASGKQIGAYIHSDTPGGACQAFRYDYGDVLYLNIPFSSDPSCPGAETCLVCSETYPGGPPRCR